MIRVTIVVPVRNEEKYIEGVLQSIVDCDYSKDALEVLVVDGVSTDRTLDVVLGFKEKYKYISVLRNEKKTASHAMNIGIAKATGEILVRMDAHATYPVNYVSTLVAALDDLKADNVGACVDTLPANDGLKAVAIARVMSHPFGVGNSYFRIADGAGSPIKVDTVPFGCYRREVFSKIGGFDEELIRNQDNEFNERLVKSGGTVYLLPALRVGYYARDSLYKVWAMFYQYGYFGPLVDIKLGKATRLRRYIPLIFLLSLLVPLLFGFLFRPAILFSAFSLALYVFFMSIFSGVVAVRERRFGFLFFLPLIFMIVHFSYGIGHLKGLLDFKLLRKHLKGSVFVNLSR